MHRATSILRPLHSKQPWKPSVGIIASISTIQVIPTVPRWVLPTSRECTRKTTEKFSSGLLKKGWGSLTVLLLAEQRAGWRLMISCARATRGLKGGGVARCPPCSQNAHDETVLVRCAQSRAALATPLGQLGKFVTPSLELMARLGVPVGGRVRKSRAIEDRPGYPTPF